MGRWFVLNQVVNETIPLLSAGVLKDLVYSQNIKAEKYVLLVIKCSVGAQIREHNSIKYAYHLKPKKEIQSHFPPLSDRSIHFPPLSFQCPTNTVYCSQSITKFSKTVHTGKPVISSGSFLKAETMIRAI